MLTTLLLAAALTAAPVPAESPLGDQLDRWLVAADFRGNVLVWKGGTVLLRKGYGLADREDGIPFPHARFGNVAEAVPTGCFRAM